MLKFKKVDRNKYNCDSIEKVESAICRHQESLSEVGLAGRGRWTFWVVGNILSLNLGNAYRDAYICQNSLSCTPNIFAFYFVYVVLQ